ncbi:hypothetical protein LV716_18335 [Flagellimonas sp. HMM57]|uniref:hypothetical protein n=1 Tax=unclassified Flagellimonas TaxID=2644544 RepID=UPI0013D597BD|nr:MULTISPECIES: hypothetical protein [unclassified Flagellimonas]UII76198.1 hypothetical protein LV716_18335 [Flagellimonas sp. HMM57]
MKTVDSRKYLSFFLQLLLIMGLIVSTSCSKEEDSLTPTTENVEDPTQPSTDKDGELSESDGISEDSVAVNLGNIGLFIDVRDIAKKGYNPSTAEVTLKASEIAYSKILDINPLTNYAQVLFDIEDLTSAAVQELKEGVAMDISIKDENGTELKSQSFSAESFRENGTQLKIDASGLAFINNTLKFNPEISYYVQPMRNGKSMDLSLGASDQDLFGGTYRFVNLIAHSFKSNFELINQFHLLPVQGKENTFYFKNAWTGEYFYLDADLPFFLQGPINNEGELTRAHEFLLEVTESGNVTIKAFETKSNDLVDIHILKDESDKEFPFLFPNAYEDKREVAEFRIIAGFAEWNMESIGQAEFAQPVLPPAQTSFQFNQTLRNCTTGALSSTIQIEESIESTSRFGWEESIELASERSTTYSASVTLSTSAKFFGVGVDVSATASSEYSSTTSFTNAKSKWNEGEVTRGQNLSVDRTIEVEPGKAVLAYDAYQLYENIEVPFMKKVRIRGVDFKTGISFTGEEIKAQFVFNNTEGVITEIGSDFIEASIRGKVFIDRLARGTSEAREVESNCN